MSKLPPWYEHPFGLISWWDMNKFGAEEFFNLGHYLRHVKEIVETFHKDHPEDTLEESSVPIFKDRLEEALRVVNQIGLRVSAKWIKDAIESIKEGQSFDEIKVYIRAIAGTIRREMEGQFFLWIPESHAAVYNKDAESILGAECCARFKSIQLEVEEAAKCFAVERYTASAFHLTRATEAGLKAIAKAIGFVPANDNWTLVFRELGTQFKMLPAARPAHWQTHEKFLEKVWGDLRAISKAWRNDIAHLVDTYTEEETRELLTVIPMFLRDLSKQMDENGKLYKLNRKPKSTKKPKAIAPAPSPKPAALLPLPPTQSPSIPKE
ncbi:MAG TPA: hypothetical protein VK961_04060 [Chthoniobacter sp.]|nr:hypothetical protein [Chthoniobacter sp.]